MWFFRTATQMIAELRQRMRDELNSRWTDPELRSALNDALRNWNGRVKLPMIYALADGWSSSEFEYALPDYVVEPLTPQYQAPAVYGFSSGNDSTPAPDRRWVDFNWYGVEVDGSGGRVLRLNRMLTAPGRILYWVEQGDLPAVDGEISGSHSAAATTLTLQALDANTPLHGAVHVGSSEWAFYSGVDWENNQLLNVQRGMSGGTSSLSDGAVVQWGIAAPVNRVFNQLMDQAMSYMHSLYLTDASAQERSQHERLVMFYEDRAAKFWRNWTPGRNPRMIGGLHG